MVVIISFFELLQSQNMAETNKEIKHIFDLSLNLLHKKPVTIFTVSLLFATLHQSNLRLLSTNQKYTYQTYKSSVSNE